MITTKITIKNFLAEYAQIKFKVENETYVSFSNNDFLYILLYNLMDKRPEDQPIDTGNLEIALPHRSRGKDPSTYNYICAKGEKLIEKRLNKLFWAEMHDFVDERVHEYGELISDSVFSFMKAYAITGITEDALIKNYYRWRSKTRRKIKKRRYRKAEE